MSKPLFQVRGARREDAMEMLDIDIKCFDEAWTPEEWQTLASATDEYAISVITFWGTVIGFAVFRDNGGTVDIKKLAVRSDRRLKGGSRLLIDAALAYANDKSAREIRFLLPESQVYPGPANRSAWAIKVGFVPTKPFIPKRFTSYGQVEDGVRFIRKVSA